MDLFICCHWWRTNWIFSHISNYTGDKLVLCFFTIVLKCMSFRLVCWGTTGFTVMSVTGLKTNEFTDKWGSAASRGVVAHLRSRWCCSWPQGGACCGRSVLPPTGESPYKWWDDHRAHFHLVGRCSGELLFVLFIWHKVKKPHTLTRHFLPVLLSFLWSDSLALTFQR